MFKSKIICFNFLLLFLFLQIKIVYSQTNTFPTTGSVGIGTTSTAVSALLEMISTSKGLLIPRITQAQGLGAL